MPASNLLPLRLWRFLSRPDFRHKRLEIFFLRLWWELRRIFLRGQLPRCIINGQLQLHVPYTPVGFLLCATGWSEREVGEFLRVYLKPRMVFIDVGAYVGEQALRAAYFVGESGRVYAFEPSPEIFSMLADNANANGFQNISVERLAISDECGHAVYESRKYPEGSCLKRKTASAHTDRINPVVHTTTIRTATLDACLGQYNLGRVDLIKIDTEGAELKVLQGAEQLLKSCSPALIFELSPRLYRTYGYTPEDVLKFLEARGYCVYELEFDQVGLLLKRFRFRGELQTRVNLAALNAAALRRTSLRITG